jgi:3-phosphoshikimate 1-carboxyvinyltransferase
LAVLATKLPQSSVFRRCGVLRHKESDRLAATQRLLTVAGVSHVLEGEVLTVTPRPITNGFRFDAQDDHRMAMSAAVLARLHDVDLSLRGMNSVEKSFPSFWAEAAKAGVKVEESP